MSWEILLKGPNDIKTLGLIFKAHQELWHRAKKIHPTYWDILNSYVLNLIKMFPNKDIEWYAKKAKEWIEGEEDINKSFDFKKLPGIQISSWEMLLETLNPATVKVAYNKLLEEGVKFSRYRDTQSFLNQTKENGRQVARKIIGKGSREQRDRMQSIASNFDEILPTLKKVLETSEENKRGIAAERSDNREQLIGAFIDVLGEIKLDVEIDWKDLELRVRKYFSGRRRSRQEKKKFIIDLKRKSNPNALKTLKEKIPEDAPALQDLFTNVSSTSTGEYTLEQINPRVAYNYIIKINSTKRLHGKNIRELHLPELKELVHETKNKKWLNAMLKNVLLNVGYPVEELFKQVYEDKALRKDLFLKDFINEEWDKYDTGEVEEDTEKLDENKWRKDFKQQLQEAGSPEREEWTSFLNNKKEAIRSIKLSITPAFVKFMGELAHALQVEDKGDEQKQLSDAFLEVYSPEDANTFSSNYLKQEGGGFGYMKRVQSPRIDESVGQKSQYAGRTLPQRPPEYVKIVTSLKDILLDEKDVDGSDDLSDIWDDMGGYEQERKEYHLAGTFDENAKTDFDDTLNQFTNTLEKAIAIEVYSAFIMDENIIGSKGILAYSPKSKTGGLELELHVWLNFLRFAQNKITRQTSGDIQNQLKGLQNEMNTSRVDSEKERLKLVRTTSPPLFDNEIQNIVRAVENSKDEIKDKLVELVEEKLTDIKDTPEIYINRTFSGLMGQLEEYGFIRRVSE